TGRLGAALRHRGGYDVFGVDISEAMLRRVALERGYRLARGDAFHLPFATGAFDAVVALRLVFHFADLEPVIRELARLARAGGVVVFETCNWSIRSYFALGGNEWGPRICSHGRRQVESILARVGLVVQQTVSAFLFAPRVYQIVGPRGAGGLENVER